jgi:hypothetical protein
MVFRFGTSNFKPHCLGTHTYRWTKEEDITKFLGTSLGLNLIVKNMDSFLLERIQKKNKFWTIVHLPLVGKANIISLLMNYILCFLWLYRHDLLRQFTNAKLFS